MHPGDRLLFRLQATWGWTRQRAAVLRPIWFAALLIGLVTLALQHSQARDAVGSIAEDPIASWPHFWLFASVLLLAIAGWYFPRALLYVRYWYTPDDPGLRFVAWRRWSPRVLGVLPVASLALAFLREGAIRYGLGSALLGALVGVGTSLRRPFLRRFVPGLYGQEARLRIENPTARMPRKTFLFLLLYLLFSLVLILLFLVSKVDVPQDLGPMGVLFVSMAVLLAVGSVVLVYPAHRWRLPSPVFLAVLAVGLMGRWNDNHEVRRGSAPGPWERVDVRSHLRAWLDERPRVSAATQEAPYPIFVVSAEGGGIRAAYWTAFVLARLEDEYPGFARHVFAVSGVSGGSLGGAVFAGLVADRRGPGGAGEGAGGGTDAYRSAVRGILGEDFLGPALAGWLFPDFVQRFVPWPLFPDRAAYLEHAWEEAWRDETGTDRFGEDFRRLWSDPETARFVPSLFLNGTWVEDGGRVVTSNLRLPSGDSSFRELDDMVSFLGRSMPLSTAVHMSARFTYVSPAGTVPAADGGGTRHVVDGGYFENSGALTAAEIVAEVRRAGRMEERHLLPVGIAIWNSPREETSWPPFLAETLAPLYTLFATRVARGRHAESAFAHAVDEYLEFRLQDEEIFPLGWMLSDAALDGIERRMDEPPAAGRRARIGELLGLAGD